MSPVPFSHRPAFRALLFAVVLAATWIYDAVMLGGWRISLGGLLLDLLLLFLLLRACQFLYAQFTLPVRGLRDRLKAFRHLLLHGRNAHGAAIFVQNGRKIERRGESTRRGPGLLWVDTASAVQTRTESGPKRVLGPGIHFLASGERLENTFSLHIQTYSIGPRQDEQVFEKLPLDASEEQRRRHSSIQSRRQMVTGLTRDGNEVIPEIRIVFRLDAVPSGPGQAGSRFGFDPEAVERAARSEGITVDPVTARSSPVAWNQLPGMIAVDLWREYLAKFTLEELFSAQFEALPEIQQPQERVASTPEAVYRPEVRRNWPARFIQRLNNAIEARMLRAGIRMEEQPAAARTYQHPAATAHKPGQAQTGLQIIAEMVKRRMTHAAVPILNDRGRHLKGHTVSEEYKRLHERGMRVLDVTLGGYRFDPAVEEQIVQQWRSSWHANAMTERGRVEQLEVLAAESGKQRALLEHASVLGNAILSDAPESIPSALKTLIHASQAELLSDERLHGQGQEVLGELSDLTRWLESPTDE